MRAPVVQIASCVILSLTVPIGVCAFGIPDFLELGECATVTLYRDFDPIKYSGLWFDIKSVPNEYQQTKQCVTQNYTWTDDSMQVNTRGLTEDGRKVRQGAVMHVETEATDTPNPAYMTVTATGVPAAPYQIIDTDYRTYSCVYSCLGYFGFRAEFAWVFGRTPSLPEHTIARCHAALENMQVDPAKMLPVLQGESCPYFERLDDMLSASERHLLDILGPYVPTTTTPPPTVLQATHDLDVRLEATHGSQGETEVPNSSNSTITAGVKHISAMVVVLFLFAFIGA